MFAQEALEARKARTVVVEARIAELQGIVNAAHGALVEVAAEIVDEKLGLGSGVHTPALYLAWKTGVTSAHANDLVRLAKRRDELPTCIRLLQEGSISLDQAGVIARHVPAHYEQEATEVGRLMTVRQLRSALPRFGWAPPPSDDDDPGASPKDPAEAARTVSMGADEKGWWLNARLPEDEGAVVQQAITAMTDDLHRQHAATLPEGERPKVTLADGLVCAAEAALRAGEATHPGSDRYQVHLHLDTAPDGTPGTLATHLGQRLPHWQHHLLLCDCAVRATTWVHGVPVNVGRKTRIISRRVRRLIEHRDRGCAVPGCGATLGLQIHHITHWEDLGTTDTHNLVALCRHHHRLHHQGILGITGNADLPRTAQGALTFTDRWHRVMDPVGNGQPLPNGVMVDAEATARGLTPRPYTPPLGERLSSRDFHLNPNRPTTTPPEHTDDQPAAPPPAWDHPEGEAVPTQAGIAHDPTRAGPVRAA